MAATATLMATDLAMLAGPSPSKATRNSAVSWFGGYDGEGFSPQVLALIFALSIALAFGLAYFKGKLG